MPITKIDVLQVLDDPILRAIRFSVGPIQVNAVEYDKVSDYIESGAIDVVPTTKNYSMYRPQEDTLYTRDGNPPLDELRRSNLLHECTHAITDINQYDVTRLADEVAAYLAQLTYFMILTEFSAAEPPIGPALNNMTRLTMQLVDKYKLGRPRGYGAIIDQGDIADLGRLIYAIPDYHFKNPDEKLAADGVSLSEKQAERFYQRQLQRLMAQDANGRMNADESQRLPTKVRGVSYENYVTSDNELFTLLDSFRRGNDVQKRTALQKVTRIFLTVDQTAAGKLLDRLSAPKKNDALPLRFQGSFPSATQATLLAALRLTR
jgi:hypothetical protein